MAASSSDTFGELRSLATGVPGEAAFVQLATLLIKIRLDDATLGYLDTHIASWPETTRRPMAAYWFWLLAEGRPAPAARLSNHLEVRDRSVDVSRSRVSA